MRLYSKYGLGITLSILLLASCGNAFIADRPWQPPPPSWDDRLINESVDEYLFGQIAFDEEDFESAYNHFSECRKAFREIANNERDKQKRSGIFTDFYRLFGQTAIATGRFEEAYKICLEGEQNSRDNMLLKMWVDKYIENGSWDETFPKLFTGRAIPENRSKPRLLYDTFPDYPQSELKKDRFVKIIILVHYDSLGRPSEVTVVSNETGSKVLEQSVIATAKKSRCFPAIQDHTFIPSVLERTYTFGKNR